MTIPYSPQKTRASLIGAAILSGIFTLDLLIGLWSRVPFGGLLSLFWPLLTLLGSTIGTYRGCLGLGLARGATITLTVMSFIPPLGLLVHIVLLTRLPKS